MFSRLLEYGDGSKEETLVKQNRKIKSYNYSAKQWYPELCSNSIAWRDTFNPSVHANATWSSIARSPRVNSHLDKTRALFCRSDQKSSSISWTVVCVCIRVFWIYLVHFWTNESVRHILPLFIPFISRFTFLRT